MYDLGQKGGAMVEMGDAEKLRLAETVLRQGEIRLDAQLKIGFELDRKATAFAAVFMTAAAAASGFVLAMAARDMMREAIAAGVAAALFFVASATSVWTSRPSKFFTVGNRPNNWWSDGVENRPLAESLRREAVNYQLNIECNSSALSKIARWTRRAVWIGMAALPLSLGSYAVFRIVSP